MPIFEFYHVVMAANLIFSSLTIFLVYSVTKGIAENKLIALGSAIILIFSRDFIRIAGDTLTEPMMIFMIILSYFCYAKSINKKNLFYFYLSAFIFGYAFEVKEAAALSISLFPAFILTKSKSKYFTVKDHLLFILVFFITAFTIPVYLYFKDGSYYIHDIIYSSSHNKLYFGNWRELYSIMKYGFGILSFPAVGFIILLFRKKISKLLVIFALFTPNVIFSFFGNRDNRYFVFGYISLSILTAYCFFYAVEYAKLILRFSRKHSFLYFSILLICLALWNFTHFYRPLIRDKECSRFLHDYGLRLLNSFPENTIFMLGDRGGVMGNYYIPLTKSKKEVIWSGWGWPNEKLGEVVKCHLSNGKRIIIDLDGFQSRGEDYPNEKMGLIKLMALYKTKKADTNLIELYK